MKDSFDEDTLVELETYIGLIKNTVEEFRNDTEKTARKRKEVSYFLINYN